MSKEPISSTTERTLRLIELLLAQPDGLTPQDLIYQMDISRSTLFELLRTLKNLGYAEQSEKRGRYRAGPRLQALRTSTPQTAQDLPTAFFQELSQKSYSETFLLAALSGNIGLKEVAVIAQVEGSQLVRSAYQPGLAYREGLEAAFQVLQSDPEEVVRQQGYAVTTSSDRIELALPICSTGARPDAALMLSAPSFRWTSLMLIDEWLLEMRAMAARLSYRLGAPFYTPYHTSVQPDLRPAAPLNSTEIASFLQGPWAARLACLRPDGRPHVIPVWQEWDGQSFTVVAWQGSQWSEYLLQNPNVSLTVDEPWSPLRRVVARGTAVSLPDTPESPAIIALLQRLSQRYLGTTSVQPLAGQVQRAFSIQPETLRGWQGLPGFSPASTETKGG